MMGSRERPKRENLSKKKNNYEDKVNEDHNELPGVRLCVGLPGRGNRAGHIRPRAGGSRRASLQCGHAKGLVFDDLRRLRKPRWEPPGTESPYGRQALQRRWYVGR